MAAARRTSLSPQLLHDLRAPLNQIIGCSEMVAEAGEGQPREELVADLRRVGAAGHRILELIEQNFTAGPAERRAVSAATRNRADSLGGESRRIDSQLAAAPGLLLVVDDDAENREVLSRRLTKQGHEVRTASNGPHALQLMAETAFDLVLLDIMMPDMDGYEVLGRIKGDRRLQHIPVIMISAIDEVQSVVRCIEAGAEDYLAKPFDPTLLKARIGASLEKKRGRDRETALYEQLQQNYKRLLEVEKLRDDMRNMIVHDLRTPLTSVIVGMDMVSAQGSLSETQREMMSIATGGGKTLLAMINDLLDVEKMESGSAQLHYESLSAAALIASAVEQVASLAAVEGTSIITSLGAEIPLFEGDRNKLSRTLVNLIANAVKFTPGGTVAVTVARVEKDSIRFAVRDTGAGIPAEAFDRIFEKFGQLDA
ncbi:MAG TPA: hybrid sensor histidine kinase/response regulator, partial [Thermoanaerobaculia bacterium]|nr:hybrid sensor histidine kinase/response regulator [Thermoanaerobaculia bacterium]